MAVAPASVVEDGAGNLVYTFTRTSTSSETPALTVNFAVAGSAGFGSDYGQSGAATFTTTTGTVTFLAGSNTATVTVDPTADVTVEPDETAVLTVTSGTGYNIGAPAAATGTILADEATSLAISPAILTQAEGNTGIAPATAFTFTVTRTGSAATDVTWTVNHGTTTAADFTGPLTGTVSFTGAETTETITINVVGDLTVESDEAFTVTLSGPTGVATISTGTANGTITNDDTSDVSVVVAPTSVSEDGAGNLVYTFTRDDTSSETPALTVSFTVAGSAGFGSDYSQTGAASFTTTTGSVTFLAGSNTATVTVDPTADPTIEPDETVLLTLTGSAGYNVGIPAAATGTITNDDTSNVSVAVAPTSVTEDGAGNLIYTFTRTNSSSESPTLTVAFTVGGSAGFGTDYTQTGAATFTAATGSVTFAAGSSTATVTVDPTFDPTVEPDETAVLTLVGGAGYNVGSPLAATGTITNDDTSIVTVAVAPASVTEDGAGNLVYTFTRTNTSAETPALTVDFTVAGSAGFGSDYGQTGAATFTTTAGTVTFLAGINTATVTVDPSADGTPEPDETVLLTLASGAGYNVGSPAAATGTITNDDAGTSLAISPLTLTQAEGNTGTTPATTFTFTVTRTGSTATDVNYTLNHITTTAADFTGALSGTVSFTGAETTETITISVVGDTLVEPNEDFTVTLSVATGGATISNATSTGTITNDDTSSVSVAVAPTSVTEDGAGNLVYTFTRTGTSSETPALTINFTVGGSAGFSGDYTQTGAATFNATTGTVTFLAGINTATVTVDPSADGAAEPNETVDLTVTAGTGYNVGARHSPPAPS